jgi:putative sporulation protein YyaC
MSPSAHSDSLNFSQDIKVSYKDPDAPKMISQKLYHYFSSVPEEQEIVIVCIGTDRSTGDALGPLVGTYLRKIRQPGVYVYGTLDEPVHAVNLAEKINLIEQNHRRAFIVAIDACLGQLSSVGSIQVGFGPIKPGAGVHKNLAQIGDIHIMGIVNVGGFMEYFVLQNTRLSLVMEMAEIIANSVYVSLMNSRLLNPVPYLKLE